MAESSGLLLDSQKMVVKSDSPRERSYGVEERKV